MPKIVWLDHDKVMEVPIPRRGFMSLGRGRENDIALSDPKVNRRHARLFCGPHGCLLKDMNNGRNLQVNGDRVNSHFLKHGDIIRIGNHLLEYHAEDELDPRAYMSSVTDANFLMNNEGASQTRELTDAPPERAFLRYLSGPNEGHILGIDRPLLPIGDPNGYYAAVSRRTSGYYLLNLGKGFYVQLNDELVRGAGAPLNDGDIISLGWERIEMRIFEATRN